MIRDSMGSNGSQLHLGQKSWFFAEFWHVGESTKAAENKKRTSNSIFGAQGEQKVNRHELSGKMADPFTDELSTSCASVEKSVDHPWMDDP